MNEFRNLDERQKDNEADFLKRLKEVYMKDGELKRQNFRKTILKKNDLWWKKTDVDYMALYIPQDESRALRNECISWVHIHPFTGHVGWHRTSEILRREVWWLGMDQDIINNVERCEICSRKKSTNKKKAGVLAPLPILGRPWESISMDFVTHLPKTKAGYTALYVVVDRLTKLVHVAPTTDAATAEDVAQLFLDIQGS